jgi:hypothetical protein
MHELAHIVPRLPTNWTPTLEWQNWQRGDPTKLLIWEAFVSGAAHSQKDDPHAHARDAATAAVEMLARTRNGVFKSDVAPDATAEDGSRDVLSIAGAVLLWSGCSADLSLLRAAPLVVRPTNRFKGSIGEVAVRANGGARRGILR